MTNINYNDDGSGGILVGAKQNIKNSLDKDLDAAAKKIEEETTMTNVKIKVSSNVKSNLDEEQT